MGGRPGPGARFCVEVAEHMFGGYAEQRGFDPVQGRGGRGIFRYDFTRPREDGREMFFQDKDRLRAPGRRGERKRERAIVSVGAER